MHIALLLLLVFGCGMLAARKENRCFFEDIKLPPKGRLYQKGKSKSREIGEDVKFGCDPPYELKGSTKIKIKCIERKGKAVWNEKILQKCKCPKPCYSPNRNSVISEIEQACAGENITFSCKRGIPVRGDAERTCRKNGSLTGQPLKCARCCPKPNVSNASISWKTEHLCKQNESLHGDNAEVELVCKDGHRTLNNGPFRLKCFGAKGTWEGNTPNCYNGCSRPPNPENGRILETKELYAVGVSVHYECYPGFTLQGHQERDCLPEGDWCGPQPVCSRVLCPELRSPKDGQIASLDVDKITFSCCDGYDMIGAAELACMPNGHWNGQAPKCIRNCGGCQVPKTFKLWSSRSCTKGIGGQVSDFSVDGDHSQSFGDCSVTCLKTKREGKYVFGTKNPRLWIDLGREYEVSGATVYGVKEIKEDAIRRFKLNDLQKLPHWGEITNIEGFQVHVSQTWREPVASEDDIERSKAKRCGGQEDTESKNTTNYDVCCASYIPGRYLSIHVPRNNTILSICEVDIFVKPYNNDCDNKQKFLYPENASLTHCPDPGSIENGHRTLRNVERFRVGAKVTFNCSKCFELYGSRSLTCGEDGTWNYIVFPKCLKKPCSGTASQRFCVYEDLKHGRVLSDTSSEVPLGTSVAFACDDNYVLEGMQNLTCVNGCIWSDHWPHCKLKACNKPLNPYNGKFISEAENYKVNSRIVLRCERGYKVDGPNQNVRCSDSLQWNNPLPTCVDVTCLKPNVSANVLVSQSKERYTYASRIQFICKEKRFELRGSSESECNENGAWTNKPPTCFDPCKGTPCDVSSHKKLILNENNTCECVCTDESDCSEIADPVCGSDAVTYETECHLHSKACSTRKTIFKVADGPCKQGGVCSAPKPSGDCPAYQYKWYYNSDIRKCERFSFGWCFQGINVFETQHECYKTCQCKLFCNESRDPGQCRNAGGRHRYYFDWRDSTCKRLYYTGCFGSNNNFASPRSCEKICRTQKRYAIASSSPCQMRHNITVNEACLRRDSHNHFMVTILVDSPLMSRFGDKGFVVTTGKKYWGPPAVSENNQLFLVNNESESLRCPCDALLQKGKYLITGTLPEGRMWPQFTEHDLVLPFSSYRKLEEKVRNECSELY